MVTKLSSYIDQQTKAAPLAVFRALFGLIMLVSMIRFWANGWIEKLYIEPTFFFSYYGFEWVKPLGDFTYLLFAICALSAIAVMLGYRYKWAIITFFLSFTYIELMDKTTYLNHYYFISALSFLMIFLPAANYFSLDARRRGSISEVPKWTIDSIKLLLVIVYFYAGLAKLNSDWLMEAMPLKIWLPSNYALPLLGSLLQKEWIIYAFSWGGAIYDLTIPFLLLWRPSRMIAFVLVVIFHMLTGILFPIGMFPYVMIVSALIFFDARFHERLINYIRNVISTIGRNLFITKKESQGIEKRSLASLEMTNAEKSSLTPSLKMAVVACFLLIQLLLPWRYLLYSDELFWTEEGYLFSWRVMLMEKAGYANFKVVNPQEGSQFYVNNADFLTSFQEKQMATQPDFILEYAHFLADKYSKEKNTEVEVYVESYVALNGRRSKLFIDPSINLAAQKESFKKKQWILPFGDEIKGI